MRQKQPPLIQFDRRSAIADLDELPRKGRLQKGVSAIPCVKVVGEHQIQVLVVLAPDHRKAVINSAREKAHALVSRGRASEWGHPECPEVPRFNEL